MASARFKRRTDVQSRTLLRKTINHIFLHCISPKTVDAIRGTPVWYDDISKRGYVVIDSDHLVTSTTATMQSNNQRDILIYLERTGFLTSAPTRFPTSMAHHRRACQGLICEPVAGYDGAKKTTCKG